MISPSRRSLIIPFETLFPTASEKLKDVYNLNFLAGINCSFNGTETIDLSEFNLAIYSGKQKYSIGVDFCGLDHISSTMNEMIFTLNQQFIRDTDPINPPYDSIHPANIPKALTIYPGDEAYKSSLIHRLKNNKAGIFLFQLYTDKILENILIEVGKKNLVVNYSETQSSSSFVSFCIGTIRENPSLEMFVFRYLPNNNEIYEFLNLNYDRLKELNKIILFPLSRSQIKMFEEKAPRIFSDSFPIFEIEEVKSRVLDSSEINEIVSNFSRRFLP